MRSSLSYEIAKAIFYISTAMKNQTNTNLYNTDGYRKMVNFFAAV